MVDDDVLKSRCGKLFVPFRIRRKVLTIGHGVHYGVNQTIERLRKKFIWPNLRKSVSDYVNNCRTCALVKPKFVAAKSTPILTKAPLEVVACDFIGPLPISQGCRYALVLIDLYSRYPAVYPLPDMKVGGVIKSFKTFFSLFGFPDSVLSDQGTQFQSHEFKQFLESFKIKQLRTNAYHPAGNGLCERFNGTLKRSMLSYLTSKGWSMNQWVSSLNHVLLEYRSTPHTSTKTEPFDLFLGFKAKGYLAIRDFQKKNVTDFAQKDKTKSRLDRSCIDRLFPIGSRVLVRCFPNKKFALKGDECVVVKQIDFKTIIVRNLLSGRVFSCCSDRVSPIPTNDIPNGEIDSEDDDENMVPVESDDKNIEGKEESENDSSAAINLPRRSKRVSFPPARYLCTTKHPKHSIRR